MFKEYCRLRENDWFKPIERWKPVQWHFIGLLITDLSIGLGAYCKRWSRKLKVLDSESFYLICGNKDEILIFFHELCEQRRIPIKRFLIFKVFGNKKFEKVNYVNLKECKFLGTRESEVHFHLFAEIKEEFLEILKKKNIIEEGPKKGVVKRKLPTKILKSLSDKCKNALLAGLMDGDGSVGATIICRYCKKTKTVRKFPIRCPNCQNNIDKISSLDYYISMGSKEGLIEEYLNFLKNIMGLKGHLYLHLIKKEYPTKRPEEFEKKILEWNRKNQNFEEISRKFNIPFFFHENVLKRKSNSFTYAPDVSGCLRFRFTPHFRKKIERKRIYGLENLYENNLPILKKSTKYMVVSSKANLIEKMIEDKGLS